MNRYVLGVILILLLPAANVLCQDAKFNLTKKPAQSAVVSINQSNAYLLRSATLQKPDSALLTPKGMNEGTFTGKTMNNNQMLNMQSTRYKIGNTKATSTFYYDETGKVKGASTTIGGK